MTPWYRSRSIQILLLLLVVPFVICCVFEAWRCANGIYTLVAFGFLGWSNDCHDGISPDRRH